MKKNYQKPSMEVIDIKMHQQLLAGSGQATNLHMGFGEDLAAANEEGD